MKKYDCSKTLDYVHEVARACDKYVSCGNGCPLINRVCTNVTNVTQEDIDAVQKWSDEHPELPKISKEERNFIGMFETVGGKRIFRARGDLYLSLNEGTYGLRQKWFQFIGDGESMTFEELMGLDVEEEE